MKEVKEVKVENKCDFVDLKYIIFFHFRLIVL